MATVCLQKGHCFRTRGATGTVREQEFADKAVNLTRSKLVGLGHAVHVVLADTPAPYPRTDLFVAFHLDGSTDQARRGASVGYPDEAGAAAARAWKRHHARLGFPGGFLKDNYTTALARYYGYGRARSPRRFLAEHGTATNPADRAWLFANLDLCAQAHVDAIGEILGHPQPTPTPEPPKEDPDMYPMGARYVCRPPDHPGGAVFTTDGVFRQHWESGGPGFAVMVANTKDLGEVSLDFHDSLVDASDR